MPTAGVFFSGMNDADRQTIITNLSWLLDNTNISVLIPKFVDKEIFSSSMVEKYKETARGDLRTRARDLYLDVTRRGPSAFRHLIECFIETGHFDAARKLDPDINIAEYVSQWGRENDSEDARCYGSPVYGGTHSTVPIQVVDDPNLADRIRNMAARNPHGCINIGTEPLQVQVKMATTRMDRAPSKKGLTVYKMGSRPKGYFLMINNVNFVNNIEENRMGAEVDERNLKTLFEGLGYVVVLYRNQGYSDMLRKIKEFAAKKEHKNVHSCVVAVLSHGDRGRDPGSTDIVASDGGLISTTTIIDCFNSSNCRTLIGKPKIFIFQLCRGRKQDLGTCMPTCGPPVTSSDGYAQGERTYSDILLAYSTIPGYVSIRDYYLGSWFIEALCKVFMEHAHDTDVRDMLSMADNNIKDLKSDLNDRQTSCFENWGFHKLYFNPGLYDNDDQEPMDTSQVN